MSIESRQQQIDEVIAAEGLDALIVTDLINVRYLCGYVGSNGVLVITRGRRVLLTDSRYMADARERTRGVEVVQAGRDLMDRLADVVGSGRVGFEAEQVSVARQGRFAARLSSVELVPTAGLVEGLRVIKEPEEIAAIRAAAGIADIAYGALMDDGFAGRTEAQVAWDLEGLMRAAGAEGASFDIIVASGAHGALPHAVPRPVPVQAKSLVVVDMGAWTAMRRTARAPSPPGHCHPSLMRPTACASMRSAQPSPRAVPACIRGTSTPWHAALSRMPGSGNGLGTGSGMGWGSTFTSGHGYGRRAGRCSKPAWW